MAAKSEKTRRLSRLFDEASSGEQRTVGFAPIRKHGATVGEQDTPKSIWGNLKHAAAVVQPTAGSHFFNHLITLN